MSEMVKRVAGAILVRARSTMEGPNYPTPEDCEYLARAALEEMREPTADMIDAPEGNTGIAREVWQAMIGDALNDTTR